MLCTLVNDFAKISMTDIDTEMIAEYRDVFCGLAEIWVQRKLDCESVVHFDSSTFGIACLSTLYLFVLGV